MSAYVLTPLAEADIFDIWSYIARDNEDAADRVEQAIDDACAFVAEAFMSGHSRSDLTSRPLRFWTLTRWPGSRVFGIADSTSRCGKIHSESARASQP